MRWLPEWLVGSHALLDSISPHLLHSHLFGKLAIKLRSLLSFLLASTHHLQLSSMEALHRTFGAPAALDSSICHDVTLTSRSQSRAGDRDCAVLLPLLDAWFLHIASIHDSLRRIRPPANVNRPLANAFR